MAVGWQGKLVRLVPLDEDKHLANYVQWLNDPEVTAWLLIGDFPLTKIAERQWFERAAKGSDTDVVFALETLEGRHIGTTGIHQIDHKNGTCHTGSFIGDKSLWGKGYGSDAVLVRAHYCFDVLGLRRLFTSYLDGNIGSRRMSEKAGYIECGRLPQKYWKRGAYRDEVLMTLGRDEWQAQGV